MGARLKGSPLRGCEVERTCYLSCCRRLKAPLLGELAAKRTEGSCHFGRQRAFPFGCKILVLFPCTGVLFLTFPTLLYIRKWRT